MAPRFSNVVIRGSLAGVRRDGFLPDRFANSPTGQVRPAASHLMIFRSARRLRDSGQATRGIQVIKLIASLSTEVKRQREVVQTWQTVSSGHSWLGLEDFPADLRRPRATACRVIEEQACGLISTAEVNRPGGTNSTSVTLVVDLADPPPPGGGPGRLPIDVERFDGRRLGGVGRIPVESSLEGDDPSLERTDQAEDGRLGIGR